MLPVRYCRGMVASRSVVVSDQHLPGSAALEASCVSVLRRLSLVGLSSRMYIVHLERN